MISTSIQLVQSNVSSLNHSLSSVRSKLSSYLENEIDIINKYEMEHDLFVEKTKKEKINIETNLIDVNAAIERIKHVQDNTKLEIKRIDQRIKELNEIKQNDVPSTESLDITRIALESKIAKLLDKKRRYLARRQASLEDIRKHLRMFVILGLIFKQGSSHGSIILEFSNLRPASDIKCICEIKANEDGSFSLLRTEPKIKDADQLLQQCQDLRIFVKIMRQKFIKSFLR